MRVARGKDRVNTRWQAAPGDCGWDVFSLDYHIDGPLRTVLTPDVRVDAR
jgi:hypothetical protein